MKIAGLMSGTSMDGIDVALVEIADDPRSSPATGGNRVDALDWRLLGFGEVPYADDRRRHLREAVEGKATTEALCRLHRDLGGWLAEGVRAVCRDAGIDPGELDLVGSHGHTVWHDPPRAEAALGSSLQLGNPAVVSEALGAPVVSDFRSADLAAGGQGAPLVPFADRLLFSADDRSRAIQNLGGMGNVTLLPPRGSDEELVAFDTGPGVALLDAASEMATDGASRYDRDGRMTNEGTPDPELLERLMEDPFFEQPPPRSTGRERFGAALVRELARERGLREGHAELGWPDLLATLARFTARSVGQAYRRWIVPRGVDEVYLTGGGAHHPVLVREIGRELDPIPLRPGADLGLDPDAREAVAFAVLAWAHVRGVPGNVPAATGARGPRILGSYTPAKDGSS